METAKEILDELRQPVRALRDQIPEVFTGYGATSAAVFADGALVAKTKESSRWPSLWPSLWPSSATGASPPTPGAPPAAAPPPARWPRRWLWPS